MSIGTFVESKLIIGNEKSNDLIVGKDTDTFCKGQWDFDTPKIIFPYLNTPTRIAEKFGMTMYDPITNQKGWVLSDAIMNNMIIFDDKFKTAFFPLCICCCLFLLLRHVFLFSTRMNLRFLFFPV